MAVVQILQSTSMERVSTKTLLGLADVMVPVLHHPIGQWSDLHRALVCHVHLFRILQCPTKAVQVLVRTMTISIRTACASEFGKFDRRPKILEASEHG